MNKPKNHDMRIVALTKRLHDKVDHAVAIGLASMVMRNLNANAIRMVEAVGVDWIDLFDLSQHPELLVLEHEEGLTPQGMCAWTWFDHISVGDRFREVIPWDPQPGEVTMLSLTLWTKISEREARDEQGNIGTFHKERKISFTHRSIPRRAA